jgi:glycosyltransferase involved in cell wall biosynthesis
MLHAILNRLQPSGLVGKRALTHYNSLAIGGGSRPTPQVSVIATVKNESSTIDRLLDSLCQQIRKPDQVILVDGGSQDDTLVRLQAWEGSNRLPLRVLSKPGCNISQGRNAAISAAYGPIIASTDAGVRLETFWLAELLKPFEEEDVTTAPSIVACGFFEPEAHTVFETAMGATVLPALQDVKPQAFLPSSRSVAFPKSAWEAVGGYPEWLDYCEDLVFDFRLLARGYRFHFTPAATVHFRPRGSLRAFFRQYYRYARGDGKANLWMKRHAVRYLTYLAGLPSLVWLTFSKSPLWAASLPLGAAAMLWTPYKRLLPAIRSLSVADQIRAILWVPLIRLTGDIAKMIGYPVGLVWRLRHGHEIPNWRV